MCCLNSELLECERHDKDDGDDGKEERVYMMSLSELIELVNRGGQLRVTDDTSIEELVTGSQKQWSYEMGRKKK